MSVRLPLVGYSARPMRLNIGWCWWWWWWWKNDWLLIRLVGRGSGLLGDVKNMHAWHEKKVDLGHYMRLFINSLSLFFSLFIFHSICSPYISLYLSSLLSTCVFLSTTLYSSYAVYVETHIYLRLFGFPALFFPWHYTETWKCLKSLRHVTWKKNFYL